MNKVLYLGAYMIVIELLQQLLIFQATCDR